MQYLYNSKLRVGCLLALFVLFAPFIASAGVIDDIARDFSPSSGYVLKSSGEEYLTDLDAAQGAMVGDLLGVLKQGEELVHPVTGKSLGSLDELLAVLRITKVKTGYSYALPLSGVSKITPGTTVKRYSGISAIFIDQVGSGNDLYVSISAALKNLDWQGYFLPVPENAAMTLPESDMVFSLQSDMLEVRDSKGQTIRAYPLSVAAVPLPTVSKKPLAAQASITAVPAVTTIANANPVKWENPQVQPSSGVAYEIDFPGYQLLDTLNSKVLMADFVQNNGKQFVATTDGLKLSIYRQQGTLEKVADYSPEGMERIHALNWWQPTAAGPLYLTISGSRTKTSFSTTEELELSGYILEFKDDHLSMVAGPLDYLFGTFDLTGDGQENALIGQSLDLDRFFGSVKSLNLRGGNIENLKSTIKYPPQFSAQGSVVADLTGDGHVETAFVRNGMLMIYQNGKLLYRLGNKMGGSLSNLTYDTNPGQVDALFTSVAFEVSPIAYDIDNDGQLELVVISSAQPGFMSFLDGDQANSSQLSVIKYQDGSFKRGSLGGELKYPVQGLSADGNRVVVMTYDPQSTETGQVISHLLAIPLSAQTH